MKTCCCSLAGTKACEQCGNNAAIETVILPISSYDKCINCANRIVASPECIHCDGEKNFKPMEPPEPPRNKEIYMSGKIKAPG